MSSTGTSGIDLRSVEQKAVLLVSNALPERIVSAAQYRDIAEEFKAAGAILKEIGEGYDPIIAQAHVTHKLAIEKKAKYERPVLARRAKMSALLGAYEAEQKRIAREKEEAERRKLLELERERQEREAAAARKAAAEKEAEAERARNDAAAAQALAEEAFGDFDGQQAEALQAEAQAQGDVATRAQMEAAELNRLATEIATAPVNTPAVRHEPDVPKVAGVSGRTTWFAEVINKREYVEHVLANWARYEASIEIDMSSLNRTATSVKKEIEIEPGVMARPKHGAVGR